MFQEPTQVRVRKRDSDHSPVGSLERIRQSVRSTTMATTAEAGGAGIEARTAKIGKASTTEAGKASTTKAGKASTTKNRHKEHKEPMGPQIVLGLPRQLPMALPPVPVAMVPRTLWLQVAAAQVLALMDRKAAAMAQVVLTMQATAAGPQEPVAQIPQPPTATGATGRGQVHQVPQASAATGQEPVPQVLQAPVPQVNQTQGQAPAPTPVPPLPQAPAAVAQVALPLASDLWVISRRATGITLRGVTGMISNLNSAENWMSGTTVTWMDFSEILTFTDTHDD